MAARECEIEMTLEILDEVAFLFVEQFDTYDRIRFNNVIKAKTAISASRLIVSDSGGYYHLGAGLSFHVDKPILWAVSAISAAATGTNNYLSYPSCTKRI